MCAATARQNLTGQRDERNRGPVPSHPEASGAAPVGSRVMRNQGSLIGRGIDAAIQSVSQIIELLTPLLFVWVFGVMIWCSFGVVRHAVRLDANPALCRDTMLVVIMIVLNGIVGAALLIGGLRHKEYFLQPPNPEADDHSEPPHHATRSVGYHAVLLVLTMLPIVLLSRKLALLVDFGIGTLAAPAALGGILVAVLVLSPEGMAAVHAALANRRQRAVNICPGSALATIGLTVPAVLVIGLITGQRVILGLDEAEMVLLLLTLLLSALTFGGIRTNMLQRAVHLVIFAVYSVLIFSP